VINQTKKELSIQTCERKKRYSKYVARIILKTIRKMKKPGSRRNESHIYKCPHCEKYHLTSNANWKKKKKKKG